MEIVGITTCVGKNYYQWLCQSLPIWKATLQRVVIVTEPNSEVCNLRGDHVDVLETGIFYSFGAYFNKGAALNEAFKHIDPQEWCLSFDCDVIPPKDWVAKCKHLSPHVLYGAARKNLHGRPANLSTPFGYFQLWHVSSLNSCRWPLFDNYHYHAGGYDVDFLNRWGRFRCMLPFQLTHQGPNRKFWFGEDNTHLMPLVAKNPRAYREAAKQGINRLPTPKPIWNISLRIDNPELRMVILRAIRNINQFSIFATGVPEEQFSDATVVDDTWTVDKLEDWLYART